MRHPEWRSKMPRTKFKFADLDEESLKQIKDYEEAMDACILALAPRVDLADLAPDDVEKLRALEEELGVVLIAYKE
jgi:hypothetical protein